MFKKIIKKIRKFKQSIHNNKCYKEKVEIGLFQYGLPCKGIIGGDRYSAYICYRCSECKHYNKT